MIQIATSRNLDSGITTLTLDGELTVAAVPPIRKAARKAAYECPTAVLVDLSGLNEAVPYLLSVFATATSDAKQSWGVPIMLCAPDDEVRRGLAAFRTRLALYETCSEASLAVHAGVPFWVRRRLTPMPANAKIARDLVGTACTSWGLEHLSDGARLVASELAANAITHAATEFDVTVSYTGTYLRIGVQDGSPTPPRASGKAPGNSATMPTGGRGLYIVAEVATHSGHVGLPDGKIVWALLRAAPPGTPR
ncbi:ATP-binding protein [Actinoplanes sp. CA-142083]|uniref:ATP-binding protein n=1 Tax=Actinoplanes sp. CA-142083 TaxID=3239903 RepID=UPI003D8CDB52